MSNPYELRFKILEMSLSFLLENQNKDRVYQLWEAAKEKGINTEKYWDELQPKQITIADIKEKAEELNLFVTNKDK